METESSKQLLQKIVVGGDDANWKWDPKVNRFRWHGVTAPQSVPDVTPDGRIISNELEGSLDLIGLEVGPQEDVDAGVEVWFHGTHIHLLPQILEQGFSPCMGAGAEHVARHFGVAVPGVYVADNFSTASQYPIYNTTGPVQIPGNKKMRKDGVPGGSYVAYDGTPPLRCVLRCLARRRNKVWRRGTQAMFKPKDLFISHVMIYAVHPRYCHYHSRFETLSPSLLDPARATAEAERLIAQRHFQPTAVSISAAVFESRDEKEDFPASLYSVDRNYERENPAILQQSYIERKGAGRHLC